MGQVQRTGRLLACWGVQKGILLWCKHRDEGTVDCWGLLWVLYSGYGVTDRTFTCYSAGSAI